MAALVPPKRTTPHFSEVQIGAPVRGRLFRELAQLMHWARGHGWMLIPGNSPGVEVAASSSATLRYRVQPGGQAIARLWYIVLRSTPMGAGEVSHPTVTVTYPDSVVQTVTADVAGDEFNGLPGFFHLEQLSAKSSSLQELSLLFTHSSGTETAVVESVSCCELPRALLTQDATDRGVDLETLRSGQPIYEGTNRSLYPIALGWANTEPRRHLAELAFTTFSVSAGSFTDVFALPVPIVPRKGSRTATTRLVQWDVYARTSLGSVNGEIRITCASSGATDTLTITGSTSFSWRSPGTVSAKCEDVSTADGLQGSSVWETFQIAMRVTAGVGTIELSAVSVWEDT